MDWTLAAALDALDVLTDVLGQDFVDAAWTAFASRSSSALATRDELDRCFVRVDQRKDAAMVSAPALPVASFRAFVVEYVKRCVAQHASLGIKSSRSDVERDVAVPTSVHATDGTDDEQRRHEHSAERAPGRSHSTVRPSVAQRAGEPSAHTRHRARAREAATAASAHRPPKALAHVESKLKPALDARRAKLLRVQKTQTQVLKERLARARLDEYAAKRLLDVAAGGGSGRAPGTARAARRLPLSDIPTGTEANGACRSQVVGRERTRSWLTLALVCAWRVACGVCGTAGAAALEIADDFIKSPLLERFSRGKENTASMSMNHQQQQEEEQGLAGGARDPLQEELYGAAALDDAFLGCSVPPTRTQQAPQATKRATRSASTASYSECESVLMD